MMQPQQPQFVQSQPFQPTTYQQAQPVYQAPPPPPPQAPPPAPPPQEPAVSSSLLSETRHQQTEVRLEISKIASKMDEVSSKVGGLPMSGTPRVTKGSK